MSRIYTFISIRRPIDEVFAYVTTPANWPRWHPSSLGVRGAADHPLEVGEQVTEDFRVAGRCGEVVWTVRDRSCPQRWRIEGQAAGWGGSSITYTLTAEPGGVLFERELVYSTPGLLLSLLDRLLLRRRIRAESSQALRRLQAVLENAPAT